MPSRRRASPGTAPASRRAPRDLLAQQPLHGAAHRRMIASQTRLSAARAWPTRCPTPATCRPENASPFSSSKREALHALEPLPHHRMIERIALRGSARSANTPTAAECRPSCRRPPGARRPIRSSCCSAARGRLAAAALRRALSACPPTTASRFRRLRACAVRVPGRRSRSTSTPSSRTGRREIDDAQRPDRAARPAREIIEIERRPRGKMHDLRRHRRHAVPRILAEQRHPDLGEHARFAKAAQSADHRERALHRIARRVDAQHFERDVRFDRRAEIRRPVVVQRPVPSSR